MEFAYKNMFAIVLNRKHNHHAVCCNVHVLCICATGSKAKTQVLCFDEGHCFTVKKMTSKYQYLLALNAKHIFVELFSEETYSNI